MFGLRWWEGDVDVNSELLQFMVYEAQSCGDDWRKSAWACQREKGSAVPGLETLTRSSARMQNLSLLRVPGAAYFSA
jgi:hypothetical protein